MNAIRGRSLLLQVAANRVLSWAGLRSDPGKFVLLGWWNRLLDSLFRMARFLAGALVCLQATASCHAGLTASEVVVVVNGGSVNSRTLANHYVRLRKIPPINVVVLESVPNSESIPVEAFRERILKPLFQQLSLRGLAGHIQCIAYSADFPTAIDIKKDVERVKDLHHIFTPVASINGLTYLYELSLTANPAYVSPDVNYYARRSMESYFSNPGGSVMEGIWRSINDLIAREQHAQAVEELLVLSQRLPHQFPVKYLAAAQAAKANQPEAAIKLLEEAIGSGWASGGYLATDARFDSVRERDDFQLLEILLDADSGKWQPTIGFNNRTYWAPNGVRFQAAASSSIPGIRYLLSTVLGVTRGGGTTLQEAIEILTRAAQADFSHPDGGFYFASTDNVRTQTRQPLFGDAIDELKKLGFEAEEVTSTLPMRKAAVLGAQIGVARFDWSKSSSTLVPGSIAENLTSLGAVMANLSGQTKLTEFLKAGAAGSSGTVTEPYSVQFKFPDPYLYVHYARGSSLAEAFYQSVTGPYQLLIVGDPLCQPFSSAPNPQFDEELRYLEESVDLRFAIDTGGPSYSEWMNLPQPASQRKTSMAPARLAVQIDGTNPKSGMVQPNVNIHLGGLPPGYHEVQVLMIADDPLNQRSLRTIPVWLGPRDTIRLSLDSQAGPKNADGRIQISLLSDQLLTSVKSPPGTSQVSIWHDYEMLASSDSPMEEETSLHLVPSQLGMGPVRLQAKATLSDGSIVQSIPVWIEVIP